MCAPRSCSCPLLPVRAGEIQCRGLGAKVEALRRSGAPGRRRGRASWSSPSRCPRCRVVFWNDPDGERYRASYFDDVSRACGATATGSDVQRARHVRDLRTLRLDAQPRRRAHGHERVLPRRRSAARDRGQPGGRHRSLGDEAASSGCSSCWRRARRSTPRCSSINKRYALSSRRATCPTSSPCATFRARSTAKSSRCPSSVC